MDEDLLNQLMENLPLEDHEPVNSMEDCDSSSPESEEELPIIEATEVELVQEGASGEGGCYLLLKKGRSLQLAVTEGNLTALRTEHIQLLAAGSLPHIRATDLEVISDLPLHLVVYSKTAKAVASYPRKQYSADELLSLGERGELELHPLATEPGWCLITLDGVDALFGSRDLIL